MVKRFNRNPGSGPLGFLISIPPISLAKKFSSSLARGFGAMISCRNNFMIFSYMKVITFPAETQIPTAVLQNQAKQ